MVVMMAVYIKETVMLKCGFHYHKMITMEMVYLIGLKKTFLEQTLQLMTHNEMMIMMVSPYHGNTTGVIEMNMIITQMNITTNGSQSPNGRSTNTCARSTQSAPRLFGSTFLTRKGRHAMDERKRTAAYYRGRDDAEMGAAPDYSQATLEQLNDYRDGYRDGLAEKAGADE